MQSTPQSLPDDPVILHGIISQLTDQLAESECERCAQAWRMEALDVLAADPEPVELTEVQRVG